MENEFLFHHTNNDCKNLILFVHGFTGDVDETWRNKNGKTFPSLLVEDTEIHDSFDVASYSYFTTLLNLFADAKKKTRWVISKLWNKQHVKEKNLDINELSSNLSNHIRFTLDKYDNIYVIAHSMGGLIVKNLIANDLKEKGATKVRLFLSLAVPHYGATLAELGKLVSSNLQINNLSPVEEFIPKLNQTWIDLDLKPTTKYFYGGYDEIVTKHSAVSVDNIEKDVISLAADHSSICKPESKESLIFKSVIRFIKEEFRHTKLSNSGFQRLDNGDQFDNELFVIKLIVSGIAGDTQKNAKELYYNAEFMRKVLSSSHNKEELRQLFDNIRQLYKDCYDEYLADSGISSGKLLSNVHSRIADHDAKLLKTLSNSIKNYHKKGMLHQLANDENQDIWWSKSRDLSLDGDIS